MIILESTYCIEFHVRTICDYTMELGPQAQTLEPIIKMEVTSNYSNTTRKFIIILESQSLTEKECKVKFESTLLLHSHSY
jgi:hypothetical protein